MTATHPEKSYQDWEDEAEDLAAERDRYKEALESIFDSMHWGCNNSDHAHVYKDVAILLGYADAPAEPQPIQTPYDF